MDNYSKIVLVRPSHPGNIGSVARAMKTMGFGRLTLVAPKLFPHPSATAMACGADDLLKSAQVVQTLAEALADCNLVFGTSNRTRGLAWPLLSARQAAGLVVPTHDKTAIVFGPEASGLSNDELQKCHHQITIPTSRYYQSLNLAQAVQVICYEIFSHHQGNNSIQQEERTPASGERLEGFFSHLEQILWDIKFLSPKHPEKLIKRVRRLYLRANLDDDEINILRGMLSKVKKALGEKEASDVV